METTDIKNLKINIWTLKILGIGTLGICFLLEEGKVLKIFLNRHRVSTLKCHYPNLIEHFSDINSIGNETYMVPEKLLMRGNEVIGYIASYGYGRKIAHFPHQAKVNDIIEAFDPLIIDTKQISEQKFRLSDVHGRNILYDQILNRFFCIDLDKGSKENLSSEFIMRLNMRAINRCIICSLFGVDILKKHIEFYDSNLQRMYQETTLREYKAIYDFFAYLLKFIGDNDPSVGTLHHEKRKILRMYPIE